MVQTVISGAPAILMVWPVAIITILTNVTSFSMTKLVNLVWMLRECFILYMMYDYVALLQVL